MPREYAIQLNSLKLGFEAACLGGSQILLEGTLVLLLLGRCLESTVTKLGRGIDPFEVDLLEGTARGVREHGLAEGHDTLLDTGDGALEHDKVVVDGAVADEASHTERKVSGYNI